MADPIAAPESLYEGGFKGEKEKQYDVPGFEGASVTVKRWNHGETMKRSDLSMVFVQGEEEGEAEAKMRSMSLRFFDFKTSIVDHNIGLGGKKVDFSNRKQVEALDPELASAISEVIGEHNGDLKDEVIPKSAAT